VTDAILLVMYAAGFALAVLGPIMAWWSYARYKVKRDLIDMTLDEFKRWRNAREDHLRAHRYPRARPIGRPLIRWGSVFTNRIVVHENGLFTRWATYAMGRGEADPRGPVRCLRRFMFVPFERIGSISPFVMTERDRTAETENVKYSGLQGGDEGPHGGTAHFRT
jgi:hypothetical protein